MQNVSTLSSRPLKPDSASEPFAFRTKLRAADVHEIEKLVARTGVFNDEEILVAGSLAQEAIDRGEAAGYAFLFLDGEAGLDGYACYGHIPGTERRYELFWIAVDAHARRLGLARALLAATENAVRRAGGTHLFAETSSREEYAPAHALYVSQGYTRHCTVPDYHADGDDLAIFGKKL
jgi:ribosomal protein S18 acetylase RimI-like enzyme